MRALAAPRPVLTKDLFFSPTKSFVLPPYAEARAHASVQNSPTCVRPSRYLGDPRVFQFLDISAVEDLSASETSSL